MFLSYAAQRYKKANPEATQEEAIKQGQKAFDDAVKDAREWYGPMLTDEMTEQEKYDYLREEVCAQYFGTIAASRMDSLAARLDQTPGLLAKIRDAVRRMLDALKEAFNALAGRDPVAAAALAADEKHAERVLDLFLQASEKAEQKRTERQAETGAEMRTQAEQGVVGEKMEPAKNALKMEYQKPVNKKDISDQQKQFQDIKSVNSFSDKDLKTTKKWAYRYYKQMGYKSPFFRAWMDWRQHDTKYYAKVVSFGYAEKGSINTTPRTVLNHDSKFKIKIDKDVIGDSLHYAKRNKNEEQTKRLLSRIDLITKNAILLETKTAESTKGNNKKSSTLFMHYLYCPISVNGAPFMAKLTVEEYDVDGKTRAYNLREIKMSNLQRAQFRQMLVENRGMYALQYDALTVSQLYDFVKQYDKDFTPGREVSPKVLNKDGTPKVFYHGTPNGTFTVFKNWQYFTEDKNYADIYQNQGASSNGYKKTADNPTTYPVYLNASKPFDTRNKAEKQIFEKEFFGRWGNGTPLSDRGLPDWTDADDLIEFFEEKGYDYDAILLDEGGTGGYGDEVHERGISIAIRDANQIKSAETGTEMENAGTFSRFNNNIRYSLQREADESTEDTGVAVVDATTVSAAPTERYSLSSWEYSEYVRERENTIKAIMDATGESRETVEKYIDDIDSIARLIAEDRARLDYDAGERGRASIKRESAEERFERKVLENEELKGQLRETTKLLKAAQKKLDKATFDAWIAGQETGGRVPVRNQVLDVVKKYNDPKLSGVSHEALTKRIVDSLLEMDENDYAVDVLVNDLWGTMFDQASAQTETVENEMRDIIRGVTNGGKYSISDEEFDELAEMAGGRRHQNFFAEIRDRLTGLMLI